MNTTPHAVTTTAEIDSAIRGPLLTYTGDPYQHGLDRTMVYEADALVAMSGGRIACCGPAAQVIPQLPAGLRIEDYGRDSLILPGFIDCHVHYPQTEIIAGYGVQLIDWLEKYAFVAERRFADASYARSVARAFLRESIANGVTTACVYCTVHPQSVDAFFEEAGPLGARMIAGKVLMDRNAPPELCDTAQRAYDESRALIEKWHGRGRLMYAITPRFAVTSSEEQLAAAGTLRREFPDCFLQSHISENRGEVAWVRELFPQRKGYLDVYDHFGLLGRRAIYGHGIWLSENEIQRCHDTGTAIAHCPTSNFFLGSGCLDVAKLATPGRPVRVGLATDLGGGTSFSFLRTMGAAYQAAQMSGSSLSPGHAFYLATRGTARALYLEDKIGSVAPGMEADLVVLDMKSTPIIEFRMRHARDLAEALFIQMIMGDERAVRATYVGGQRLYLKTDDPLQAAV